MPKVALVTGANGISGNAIVEYLSSTSPQEWSKIFALSRRPPTCQWKDPRVQFISIDLTAPLSEIKKKLKEYDVNQTTHLFHTAYVHNTDEDKLIAVNAPMFENTLRAVDELAPNLERVVLQTGAKYYGWHLKPCNIPIKESDGRHSGKNFYFNQEDFLTSFQKGKKWSWNVVRPFPIVGVTRGNGMSIAPSLAIYFLVQKELNLPALYPGNPVSFKNQSDMSYAPLVAEFSVWLTSCPQAANEDFNIVDGDQVSWCDMWSGIGKYFGVVPKSEFKITTENSTKKQLEFSLVEYMKDKKPVWDRIVQKYGGDKKAWDYTTFEFADLTFSFSWGAVGDMSKAKKLGWNKKIKSIDGFQETFKRMQKEEIIPSHFNFDTPMAK